VNRRVDPDQSNVNVNAGDIDSFLAELANGPISIAIEADQPRFQQYNGGVIAIGEGCGQQLDHAVLAVGNGNEDGRNYVLVKNSWGSGWGDGGFVKLEYANGNSACGFLNNPTAANIK
jgi:C1A family cysteine protease